MDYGFLIDDNFTTAYRQPLIFQYIYHIKLATLGAYIELHMIIFCQ